MSKSSKDAANDAALLSSIGTLSDERAKYQKVKDAISENNLHTMQDLSDLKDYINHCKDLIKIIDGNSGYAYLSNFKSKLQEDKNTLKKYYDYCKDANKSFKELYDSLDTKIRSLDTQISSKKSAYNKDKPIWEWVW